MKTITSEDLRDIENYVTCECGNVTITEYSWMDDNGCVSCPRCMEGWMADEIDELMKSRKPNMKVGSLCLADFIREIEYMQGLYSNARYTQAEATRDKLTEQLDNLMRLGQI